jgi:hypothetical protein
VLEVCAVGAQWLDPPLTSRLVSVHGRSGHRSQSSRWTVVTPGPSGVDTARPDSGPYGRTAMSPWGWTAAGPGQQLAGACSGSTVSLSATIA